MLLDDKRHGSEAGHEQHCRDGEIPCAPCHDAKLKAARRRTKRKTMGHRYLVPIGPRVHAKLADLRERGATHEDIAAWADIVASQAWRCCNSTPDALIYPRTKRKLLLMQPGLITTPIGLTRRLQGLAWLGYSNPVIAKAAGVHNDTIVDAIKGPRVFMARKVRQGILTAYAELSMHPATGDTQQDRAGVSRTRNIARRKGYAPPMAWDDDTIDNPAVTPHTAQTKREKTDLDEVVVLRVMNGEHLPLTPAERTEVVTRLRARGMSYTEIERHTGITKIDRHVKKAAA